MFVDDGSADNTWDMISDFAKRSDNVTGIRLAHNAGHQNALYAGLERAMQDPLCDFSVTIDVDLQQDTDALEKFIEEYYKGADIVFGVRNSRNTDSFIKKTTAKMFYRSMSLFGAEIIENHADYRLMSRRAMEALLQYKEYHLFLRGLVLKLGFNTSTVYFDVKEREQGTSKYTMKKMLRFASDGITSFSSRPLHLIATLGIVLSVVSFIMIAYFVAAHFLGKTVYGWTSILCSLWLLCGIILMCMGVIGEYIGKLYVETKCRPKYFVSEDTSKSNEEE